VTSFNQAGYENNRYSNSVKVMIAKVKVIYFKWFDTHAFQSAVLLSGLLAGAFLAAVKIRNGLATAGQFAMLLMYWSQLSGPLLYMTSLGKQTSSDLIEAERLLEIMLLKPTVTKKKCARPLKFISGDVEFDDVKFCYNDQREIIKGMSLFVPGGQSVAFVGATGAGKSTILKLLNRFYDVKEGAIRIDGQDLRDIDIYRFVALFRMSRGFPLTFLVSGIGSGLFPKRRCFSTTPS
jgi:ABC-type multidrug transport system fused ATPase/permease subunit